MAKPKQLLSDQQIRRFVPSISIDCVVFGYLNKKLHVLLIKYKYTEAWSLPGGFLEHDAEMDETATNIVSSRTGIDEVYLNQFYTFSALNRHWKHKEKDWKCLQTLIAKLPEPDQKPFEQLVTQRYISTAYFALLDATKVYPKPDMYGQLCDWIPALEIPELVLDHNTIVNKAICTLRKQLNFLPIGKTLMPDRFTMSEFQSLYEAILGKSLDRGNFQRKIMKLGFLIRHEKLMTGAQNKAPYLYSINHEVYDKLVAEGVGF